MNEEVRTILLNDMPVNTFVAYYIASLIGAFVWFVIKTFRGIWNDPDTPSRFSPKYFWRGLIKFGISILVLPWAVIYFPDYGPFILDGLFKFPGVEDGEYDLVIEMNAGSAALIGFFVDGGIRRLTHHRFKKILP